jgi:phosphatidylserine/phosphatidylglycerophosphate/cardiolipin synthase-like enzyme
MIVEASASSRANVLVLTRPPRDGWHKKALQVLHANLKPTVLYNPQLHAKLYILESDGFRYALLGSPNLTRRADRDNVEIAIEFRTSYEGRVDKVSTMINELIVYASALFADDEAKLSEE